MLEIARLARILGNDDLAFDSFLHSRSRGCQSTFDTRNEVLLDIPTEAANVRDIVLIAGAQDYAEVTTLTGSHLVRMSLGEFEQRLDPARFIRVHRSHIINIDHLDHAEPAGGGRLVAYMVTGAAVPLSRTGSQTLRQLIV